MKEIGTMGIMQAEWLTERRRVIMQCDRRAGSVSFMVRVVCA